MGFLYLNHYLVFVIGIIRCLSRQENEEHDPNGPHVYFLSVLLVIEDLGSHVERSTDALLQLLASGELPPSPKVDKFDVVVLLNTNVLRLDVPMNVAHFVQVADAREHLVHDDSRVLLGVSLSLNDLVEQLASWQVIHDQVEVVAVHIDFVELHDVLMVHLLEDVYLTLKPLHLVLVVNLLLFDEFSGSLYLGDPTLGQDNLPKATLSQVLLLLVAVLESTLLVLIEVALRNVEHVRARVDGFG